MELILDSAKPRKKKFTGSVAKLISELDYMREEVLVKINGKIVPETRTIKSTDKVEIIKVVFGG